MNNATKEKWKEIPGFNGLYEVSNFGNVRSWNNNKWGRSSSPKIKSLYTRPTGYLTVGLKHDKTKYVHKLVAEAFIPNPENKPCINHKDGDKSNNNVDNLEWCTYSENHEHAYKNGIRTMSKETKAKISKANKGKTTVFGESHGNSILTKNDVIEIRKTYPDKTQSELAAEYNVSISSISKIVRCETWVHV